MARKAMQLTHETACGVLTAAVQRYERVKMDAMARAGSAKDRDDLKAALADYWQAQDVLLATADELVRNAL